MYTGGGDIPWNQPFPHMSDLCDLDLGSGHTAYRRVSLIDLYLYRPNFVQIGNTFCGWTDIRGFDLKTKETTQENDWHAEAEDSETTAWFTLSNHPATKWIGSILHSGLATAFCHQMDTVINRQRDRQTTSQCISEPDDSPLVVSELLELGCEDHVDIASYSLSTGTLTYRLQSTVTQRPGNNVHR